MRAYYLTPKAVTPPRPAAIGSLLATSVLSSQQLATFIEHAADSPCEQQLGFALIEHGSESLHDSLLLLQELSIAESGQPPLQSDLLDV